MEDVHHIDNDSVSMAHFFLLFNFLALTEKNTTKQMNFQQQKPPRFNEFRFYSEGLLWEEDY